MANTLRWRHQLFRFCFLLTLLLSGVNGCSLVSDSTAVASADGKSWHCRADSGSQADWHCTHRLAAELAMADKAQPQESHAQPPHTLNVETSKVSENSAAEDSLASVIARSALKSAPKALANSGYTVQLGAYSDRQKAVWVVEDLALQGDVQIREIVSSGRIFSVIIVGRYASAVEAEQQAQRLSQQHPDLTYWVRSIKSLHKAAVQ